jgi:asparagine synthase (glutamine-hydrolysing)
MCGINGIFGEKNIGLANEKITGMNQCMQHRGPDDHGIFAAENIALGHQRLSILDLSSAGKQPMLSNSGRFVLSFNGEIYNFKEVKKELGGYSFTTQTDSEVILAAFEKWGLSCLEKFNGMFAIAIWDKLGEELFLARDRMGIKPLYYFQEEGKMVFSSEIRSLLASGMVPRRLNNAHLSEFLEYQTVNAPNTLIANVKMLEAGHWMKVSKEGVEKKAYWEVQNFVSKGSNVTKKEAQVQIKELFFQSTERRMLSDVPFGAFLSGGIDSSAVVAAMSKMSSNKIETFNISFAEKEFSEAKYAAQIAKLYNTNHHEIQLTPEDFLKELPHAMQAMDHPSGDGPNSFIISKATKNTGVTVALSGLGGDELFCGYDVFPLLNKLEHSAIRHLPLGLRKALGNLLYTAKKGNKTHKIKTLLAAKKLNFEHAYPLFRQTLWKEEIEKIVGSYTSNSLDRFLLKDNTELYSKISVAEMQTYMQNTLLRDTDQMSMANALEVRVPFLDHKLVEYVLSLPDSIKHPNQPKKLFVDSMGDLLPESIWKRKKMGFTLPWSVWMKKELKSFCEENLKYLQGIQSIDYKSVEGIWNNFQNGVPLYTWTRVWPLVVLGHWIKENKIEG